MKNEKIGVTKFRDNLKETLDLITDNSTIVRVTRPNREDIIVMSCELYEKLNKK